MLVSEELLACARASLAKNDRARMFTCGHVVVHRSTAYGIDYVREFCTYEMHSKTLLNPRAATWH